MRLDPLYTVTITTPEAWSVEVASDAGIEGRGFLLAEGRSAGRLLEAGPNVQGLQTRRLHGGHGQTARYRYQVSVEEYSHV
jgi:hypothetical protein